MSKLIIPFKYFFIFFIIAGCATVHSGEYAIEVKDNGDLKKEEKTGLGMIISGKEVEYLSSMYFGFIDLTFENKSQNWIRIKKIKVDLGKAEVNSNVKFTSGRDIIHWDNATRKRNAIREHNERVVLGSIAALGYGLALTDNQKLNMMGSAAGLGAIASLAVSEYNKNLDKIQNAKIFPESHLLAEEFIIPPGLFVKKWILLNTSNHKKIGFIRGFYLEYETDSGKNEKVQLVFREKYVNGKPITSLWQEDLL